MTKTLPAQLAGLTLASAYPHHVGDLRVIETHISWIVLTGDFAYKLKKPLDLGFLDFSTLGKRRQACRMEVTLNRRLAPALYLDVVPVRSFNGDATLLDHGRVIDFAVRMRQFPQQAQLDRMLATGKLDAAMLQTLAQRIARFQETAAVAAAGDEHGDPARVVAHMLDNFPPARTDLEAKRLGLLDELEAWTRRRGAELSGLLAERQAGGRVREGHGDLHLSNLVYLDDGVAAFDCIEFSETLRWIDVLSEVAFLVMDLMSRRRDDLAYAFLNAYLETTGDYPGIAVLRLYLVYRSMVRAKVASLTLAEQDSDSPQAAQSRRRRALHIDLAARLTQAARNPHLVLMHGLSGSGKSRLAGRLATRLGAIRIRSDVERKRLAGLSARQRSGSEPDAGLYTTDATARTYERLAQLASQILSAGFHVIVDAAFLTSSQRVAFAGLATQVGAVRSLVACTAAPRELERRVKRRSTQGRDASEATVDVLDNQRRRAEPLTRDERANTIEVVTDNDANVDGVVEVIRRRRREATPSYLPGGPSSPDPAV